MIVPRVELEHLYIAKEASVLALSTCCILAPIGTGGRPPRNSSALSLPLLASRTWSPSCCPFPTTMRRLDDLGSTSSCHDGGGSVWPLLAPGFRLLAVLLQQGMRDMRDEQAGIDSCTHPYSGTSSEFRESEKLLFWST